MHTTIIDYKIFTLRTKCLKRSGGWGLGWIHSEIIKINLILNTLL